MSILESSWPDPGRSASLVTFEDRMVGYASCRSAEGLAAPWGLRLGHRNCKSLFLTLAPEQGLSLDLAAASCCPWAWVVDKPGEEFRSFKKMTFVGFLSFSL